MKNKALLITKIIAQVFNVINWIIHKYRVERKNYKQIKYNVSACRIFFFPFLLIEFNYLKEEKKKKIEPRIEPMICKIK